MLERSQLPVDYWRLWYKGEGEIPVLIKEVLASRRDVMNPAFIKFFEENVLDR
jgi:hypothetical protein